MAKVEISQRLSKEIQKKFKGESNNVFSLLYSLRENPKKGKEIGCMNNILIKEIKYKSFRFYFIAHGYRIRFMELEKLQDMLIKFVRMSNKKDQQKTINEIKNVLRKFGEGGF